MSSSKKFVLHEEANVPNAPTSTHIVLAQPLDRIRSQEMLGASQLQCQIYNPNICKIWYFTFEYCIILFYLLYFLSIILKNYLFLIERIHINILAMSPQFNIRHGHLVSFGQWKVGKPKLCYI